MDLEKHQKEHRSQFLGSPKKTNLGLLVGGSTTYIQSFVTILEEPRRILGAAGALFGNRQRRKLTPCQSKASISDKLLPLCQYKLCFGRIVFFLKGWTQHFNNMLDKQHASQLMDKLIARG